MPNVTRISFGSALEFCIGFGAFDRLKASSNLINTRCCKFRNILKRRKGLTFHAKCCCGQEYTRKEFKAVYPYLATSWAIVLQVHVNTVKSRISATRHLCQNGSKFCQISETEIRSNPEIWLPETLEGLIKAVKVGRAQYFYSKIQ